MITNKGWLVVGGLALLAAAGCTQPGGVEQQPTETAKKDAGKPRRKDAGVEVEMESAVGDDDDGAGDNGKTDDEGKGDQSRGDDGEGDDGEGDDEDSTGDDDDTPAKEDAARAKDAGSAKDASSAKDAGGGGKAPDQPAPCPGAYKCQDPAKTLKELGIQGTVTDADDKPVTLTCSKGAQETCDPKDPKKSCPGLPNAFCAHVVLPAPISMDLYNCAQLCTP